jgi:hypothetical protein
MKPALTSRNSILPEAASAGDGFIAVSIAGATATERSARNSCRRERLVAGVVPLDKGVFEFMVFPPCLFWRIPSNGT